MYTMFFQTKELAPRPRSQLAAGQAVLGVRPQGGHVAAGPEVRPVMRGRDDRKTLATRGYKVETGREASRKRLYTVF